MIYSDDYLREQLPGENPPGDYVPRAVYEELERTSEFGEVEDRQLLNRSTLWTYAIFSELALGNYSVSSGRGRPYAPFFPFPLGEPLASPRTIVGLFDAEAEQAGFGLSINLPGWDGPDFLVTDYIRFPRLKREFPFAIRQVQIDLHAPPHPINATTACWARCNQTQAWGLITAGHALGGNTPGIAVPLANGGTGILSRCYYQPIDAAFVLTTNPVPLPRPLSIHRFPAAGLPVMVECQNGAQPRVIVSANDGNGFFQTRQYPLMIYLDQPCVQGDSGALVRLTSGEAAGIYLASQPSPKTGGVCGLVLNFEQAMFSVDTTPYL